MFLPTLAIAAEVILENFLCLNENQNKRTGDAAFDKLLAEGAILAGEGYLPGQLDRLLIKVSCFLTRKFGYNHISSMPHSERGLFKLRSGNPSVDVNDVHSFDLTSSCISR